MTSPIPSPSLSAPWACAIGTGAMTSVTSGIVIQTEIPEEVAIIFSAHSLEEFKPLWRNRTAAAGYGWINGKRTVLWQGDLIGGVCHPEYNGRDRDRGHVYDIALCIAKGYPANMPRLHLPDGDTPGFTGQKASLVGYPASRQKRRQPELWRRVVDIKKDAGETLSFAPPWEVGTSGGGLIVWDEARKRLTALGIYSRDWGRKTGMACRLEPLVPWIREEAAKRGVTI